MANLGSNNKQLKLLLHAIEGVNRTIELKALLAKSMDSAKVLLKSEASSLMLLDELTGELNVSIPTGPVGNKIKGLSIPKGKGISGWVLEHKKPHFSNSPQSGQKFWKELNPNFKTRNILCVPLINAEDKAIGVIQVLNKNNGEDYNEEDQQIFEVFASHVATAIEKVREVDELRKKVEKRDKRLREVHTELRENLLTINSFMQIEAEKIDYPKAQNILKAACSRVLTVAHSHFVLQEDDEMEKIELGSFINELYASISAIFLEEDREIKLIMNSDQIHVDVNRAFALGLIVNEVLILLFRMAFEYQPKGRIKVNIKKAGDHSMVLEISDNGEGLQVNEAEEQSNIDLSSMIYSLGEALEADISLRENEDAGTTLSIRCPIA